MTGEVPRQCLASPVFSRAAGMQRPTGSCHLLQSSVGLLRLAYSPFRSPQASFVSFLGFIVARTGEGIAEFQRRSFWYWGNRLTKVNW
jgi:hypothetical protein